MQARRCEEGQGLAEYALILVMIGLMATSALILIGDEFREIYSEAVSWLQINGP